jgi:hypothetical protein
MVLVGGRRGVREGEMGGEGEGEGRERERREDWLIAPLSLSEF